MMTISRHRQYKVNLGNYESVDIGAHVTLAVPYDSDIEDTRKDLDGILDAVLDADLAHASELTDNPESVSRILFPIRTRGR